MKNKLFWYVIMANVALGWFFVLSGLFFSYPGILKPIWLFLILVMGIGHPLELFISIPIGKASGFSTGKMIAGTLMFGFTWWLPVKLEVFTSEVQRRNTDMPTARF